MPEMNPDPDVRPGVPEPRPAVFRSIDHIGIAVHDLDTAIAWYVEKFGMRLVHIETNVDQHVREAMLEVGESGPLLQLIAPLDEESPVARFLASRGEGLHQVAYTVDDVEAATATLRQRGVETLYERPGPGTWGSQVNFVHPKNAGGVLVEIVEPPDTAPDSTG
ncbi:MAG: methylmalonyl-CoA epimerase [Actinopolymorphaceae bacterium]|jgi:methylmalonyl-CoA/ethylmalonyl-CoA epimerase